MHIENGTLKGGLVYIKKLQEDGTFKEMEIKDCKIIGDPGLSMSTEGVVLVGDNGSVFILTNMTANLAEIIKILSAAIIQIVTTLDVNLTAITALNAKTGPGTYVPVPLTPIMQPTYQVMAQLQQTIPANSEATPQPTPPGNVENMSKEDIEKQANKYRDLLKENREKFNKFFEVIQGLLGPIQPILDLLNAFANPAIDATKKLMASMEANYTTWQSAAEQKENQDKVKETSEPQNVI